MKVLSRICPNTELRAGLDLGLQPVAHHYLRSVDQCAELYPLAVGRCPSSGVVQLLSHPSAIALAPRFEWIAYNEPEDHLDQLTAAVIRQAKLNQQSRILGLSYKDDTTLRRFREQTGAQTARLSLEEDFGVSTPAAGVETLQTLLNVSSARKLVERYGRQDLIVARHVLEHAFDTHELVAALKELLRPGGMLLFEVPDCARAFAALDYTTLWEEHILYFTERSFQNVFSFLGLELKQSWNFPYALENSLAALVSPAAIAVAAGDGEEALIENFFAGFTARTGELSKKLGRLKNDGRRIAVLGAGHLTSAFLTFHRLAEYVDLVIDDNANKQGLFMPGSQKQIVASDILRRGEIDLCLLGVNLTAEEKLIGKQSEFVKNGGEFRSIFPSSQRSILR